MQTWAGSGDPVGTLVQVPSEPASAHDLQAPLQVVAQQIPCAQMPLVHSFAAAHAAPLPLSPHEPAVHTAGATQSASAVQLVAQAAAAPQRNG